MDMETWRKLLGKSQDDKAVKAALVATGVKKPPKLAKDDVSVIVDLKGHGMWLKMIDEAFLKKLDDQDIGEGPLILTSVGAYVQRRKNPIQAYGWHDPGGWSVDTRISHVKRR